MLFFNNNSINTVDSGREGVNKISSNLEKKNCFLNLGDVVPLL